MATLLWIWIGCGSLSYYPDTFEGGPGSPPGTGVDDDDDASPQEDCGEDCDADGDGEPAGRDCDDDDPDIFPGALELCDGVDNDCDEIVDGDSDEDGSDVCDDCDDSDGGRFPGARDLCDGVDSDCDELDCLEWAEDFESGALSSPWRSNGAADWFPYSIAQQGAWSAKSGIITHGERSTLKIDVDFPSGGAVTFWYSVSSEVGYDFLSFLVDGVEKDAWSGEIAWREVEYLVPAGTHELEWRYQKDVSLSAGEDGALVDSISILGGIP
jgi:hypothetical protein